MRKIYKITNIALIFTLIGIILCREIAFSNDKLRISLSSAQDNIDSFNAEFLYVSLNILAREKLGDEYFEVYLQPYYFLWGCFEIWRTHGDVGDAMPETKAASGIINRLSNAGTREEVMEIAKVVLEKIKDKNGFGNIKWTESYSRDTLYFECKTDKGTICANIGPDRELRVMEEWSSLFRNHESSKWLSDAEKFMEELISRKIEKGDRKIDIAVFGIGWNGYSVYTVGAIALRFLKLKGQDLSEWELAIDAFDRSSRLFYEMNKYQGEGAGSLPLAEYKEFLNPENINKIKSCVKTHLVDLNNPGQRDLISTQMWDITMGTNIAPYLTCTYEDFKNFMLNATKSFSILDGVKDLRKIVVLKPSEDTQGVRVSIEIVEEREYDKYEKIFYDISEQEDKIEETIEGQPNGLKGLFWVMSDDLHEINRGNILKLLVAKDLEGNVLGASIIYKPEYIIELGGTVVSSMDAVREKYKRQGIGTKIRKATLIYLIREGHEFYKLFFHNGNDASLKNFQKLCAELNLTLEDVTEKTDSAYPSSRGTGRRYLIKLKGRDDLLGSKHDILFQQGVRTDL